MARNNSDKDQKPRGEGLIDQLRRKLKQMQDKGGQVQRAKKACESSGGKWDMNSRTCK